MFAGEFGLITMGLTYALALVLPIVGTFFLAFGLLEDSGYLPRLAIMSNRLFRLIGLNGKAILPMVLGLGCDTMATMTARILESRKERFIVTLLLALGVPCSAQLGVILGLANFISLRGFALIILAVGGSMLLVGWLASRFVPGAPSDFIFEIPPLRLPRLGNIAMKTWLRIVWFLREATPLFLMGTLALFLAAESGLLGLLERGLAPLIQGWLSLPVETTKVFILGFLRRDYGAAGLFALATADPPLTQRQPDRGRADRDHVVRSLCRELPRHHQGAGDPAGAGDHRFHHPVLLSRRRHHQLGLDPPRHHAVAGCRRPISRGRE